MKSRFTAQGLSAAQISVTVSSIATLAKEATVAAGFLAGAKATDLATAKTAIDNLRNDADAVFYDNALGVAGVDWPVGTAQYPSNSLISVQAMVTARKLRKIIFCSDANLGVTFDNIVMVGIERGIVINMNGQDVDDCHFYNCTITGTQGGTGIAYAIDCNLRQIVDGSFYTKDCDIDMTGSYQPRSASTSVFINPGTYQGEHALDYAEITFNGRTAAKIIIQGARGPWVASNSTDAANRLFFGGTSASLISLASNTFGTLYVEGQTHYDETSVSATWFIFDYSLHSMAENLIARLTAARAGYLDNINQAGLLQITAARAGYLDNLLTATIKNLLTFAVMPLVNFVQAAAVQNTWYTILDTSLNIRIKSIFVQCDVAEDIELRLTIDGNTRTYAGTVDAGVMFVPVELTGFLVLVDASTIAAAITTERSFWLESKTCKIEIRKTSTVGVAQLLAWLDYAQR